MCACGKSHGEPNTEPDPPITGTITITDSRGKSVSFAVTDTFAHALAIALSDAKYANALLGPGEIRRLPSTSFATLSKGRGVPSVLGPSRDPGWNGGSAKRGGES